MNGKPDSESTRTEKRVDYYLPATAQLSTAPTIVEKFFKTVFRRRGKFYLVRSDD